jgi:hypothetical protein
MVPVRPTPQPTPIDRAKRRSSRLAESADPNSVVGTGAGKVTVGMLVPRLSVNRS